MVKVALVGASTGVGLTLVNTLLEEGKHEVHTLSRSAQPDLTAKGVHVHVVDYTSHAGLVAALQGIHTVLVTIGSFDPAVLIDTQLAILAAAKEAGVTRFAPSEFAGPSSDGIDAYAPKVTAWDAVKASGLECTRFVCGIWMNFLATGTPLGGPNGETEALAGERPWNFVINVKNGTADFPGDGTVRLAWTEIRDLCRFIAGSLDLERWDEVSGVVGEHASFEEVVRVAERVTGRTYLRKENAVEALQKSAEVPERRFYEQVRTVIAKGDFDYAASLNKKLPHIKPTSVEEFIRKWWGGVKLDEPSWVEDQIFG